MPDVSRRHPSSERAILDATLALLRSGGLPALTIEGIAAEAGVGKQTIYRWWPSKGAVALDALLQEVRPATGVPDTGDLRADLAAVLEQVVALLADPDLGRHLVACLAEASRDPELAARFSDRVFTPMRSAHRQRLEQAGQEGVVRLGLDLDVVLDMAFGAVWFRALTRPQDLERGLGQSIAKLLLDGAASSAAS